MVIKILRKTKLRASHCGDYVNVNWLRKLNKLLGFKDQTDVETFVAGLDADVVRLAFRT